MNSLTCRQQDHFDQGEEIKGICIDVNCQALQRMWCVICQTKYHRQCDRDSLLNKDQARERLLFLKRFLVEGQPQDALTMYKTIKSELIKQLDDLEQYLANFEIRFRNQIQQIDIILEQPFSQESWDRTYYFITSGQRSEQLQIQTIIEHDMNQMSNIVSQLKEISQQSHQIVTENDFNLLITKHLINPMKDVIDKKLCVIFIESLDLFELNIQDQELVRIRLIDIFRSFPWNLGASIDTKLFKLICNQLQNSLRNIFINDSDIRDYLDQILLRQPNVILKKEFLTEFSSMTDEGILFINATLQLLPTVGGINLDQSSSIFFDLIFDLIQGIKDQQRQIEVLFCYIASLPASIELVKNQVYIDEFVLRLLTLLDLLLTQYPKLQNEDKLQLLLNIVLKKNLNLEQLTIKYIFKCILTMMTSRFNVDALIAKIQNLQSTSIWRTKNTSDWNISNYGHDKITIISHALQIKQLIFSEEYFAFIQELIYQQVKQTNVVIAKTLIQFFLNCAIRESKKDFIQNNLENLISILRNSLITCEWLINILNNFNYVEELLLDCPNKMAHKSTIRLLTVSLQTISKSQIQNKNEELKTYIAAIMNNWIFWIDEVNKKPENSAEFFDLFYRFAMISPQYMKYLISKQVASKVLEFFIEQTSNRSRRSIRSSSRETLRRIPKIQSQTLGLRPKPPPPPRQNSITPKAKKIPKTKFLTPIKKKQSPFIYGKQRTVDSQVSSRKFIESCQIPKDLIITPQKILEPVRSDVKFKNTSSFPQIDNLQQINYQLDNNLVDQGASNRVYLWRSVSKLLQYSQLGRDELRLFKVDSSFISKLLDEGQTKMEIKSIADIICVLSKEEEIMNTTIQLILNQISKTNQYMVYHKYFVVLNRLFLIQDSKQQSRVFKYLLQIQQSMTQLLKVMHQQMQSFYEIDICQQYILKIARRNQLVYKWLNNNSKVWSWFINKIDSQGIPNEKILKIRFDPTNCKHPLYNIYMPLTPQTYEKFLCWKKSQFLSILHEPYRSIQNFDYDDDMNGQVIKLNDKLDYYFTNAQIWTQGIVTHVNSDYLRLQFVINNQQMEHTIEIDSECLAPFNTLINNNIINSLQLGEKQFKQ